MLDPESPVIFYKDGLEYKANLDYVLLRLIDHKTFDKTFVLIISIMLYISKIDDYLKILTDEKVENFKAIKFSEYSISITEEQNLRKVAKLL